MDEYLGLERKQPPQQEKWRVKKEISLGDAIAIVIAISAVLGSYARLDNRISLLEQSSGYTREAFMKIDAQLEKLSNKIDKLIERRP